jgi:ABC-type Fe3+ transport system permease subunit/streptogramin lyase
MPPFLAAATWMQWLGFAGAWRLRLEPGWEPVLPFAATAWVTALLLWPVPFLAALGALRGLDAAALEADPAVRGTALLRGLLWPRARPALGTAAAVTFLLALAQFAVPALFQAKLHAAEIWVRFSTTFDAAGALAQCWPLLAAPPLLLLWLARRPVAWPFGRGALPPAALRAQLGRGWRTASAAVLAGLAVLSAGVPLARLVASPRTWAELPGAWAAGQGAALRSLLLAGLTAGVVAAAGMALARRRWPAMLWAVFFLPGVFLGLALIHLLNRPGLALLYGGPAVVLLALVLRYAAPGWAGARLAAAQADAGQQDAARLAGALGWRCWRDVILPGAGAPVAAAAYAAYLLALWDVETVLLIQPPGGETLAARVFNLLHYGHNDQVNALCLMLLALALLPLAAAAAAASSKLQAPGSREGPRSKPRRGDGATASLSVLGPWSFCGALSFALGVLSAGCSRPPDAAAPPVTVVGARGLGPGQFNKPRSVTVDGDGQVWAVDVTGRLQRFGPDGAWRGTYQMPETDKGRAKGMARAPDGGVLVVEPHYHRVNRFAPDGRLLAQWGRHGTNVGELYFPRAVAVAADGDVFISEYGVVERVQRFAPDGAACRGAFGRRGTAPGEFNRAEGLAVGPDGLLYVADSCNHRVQVLRPDGAFVRLFGRAGAGPGELGYPYDVAVARDGRVYVCEFGNSRVQVFDREGRSLAVFGGPGAAPGRMNNPWSLALDDAGDLHVADSLNHRLLRFATGRAGVPAGGAGARRPAAGEKPGFTQAAPRAPHPALP